jgi:hypothetical protein
MLMPKRVKWRKQHARPHDAARRCAAPKSPSANSGCRRWNPVGSLPDRSKLLAAHSFAKCAVVVKYGSAFSPISPTPRNHPKPAWVKEKVTSNIGWLLSGLAGLCLKSVVYLVRSPRRPFQAPTNSHQNQGRRSWICTSRRAGMNSIRNACYYRLKRSERSWPMPARN